MTVKRIISAIMTGILLLSTVGILSACGGGKGGSDANTLKIKYFTGGFGDAWLKSAAEKFEKANNGVTVKLESDTSLRTNAAVYLQGGRDLPDIMMSQNLGWSEFVQNGQIESLEKVFEAEAKPGVKIKDFIVDEFAGYPYMKRSYNSTEERPWVVPWSVLTCGIVYNEEILLKTKRASTGGNWEAPPATVAELVEYTEDLNKAKVIPFAWGGSGINWLTFPQSVWWAQAQGVEGDNNWFDFWDFNSADVYKQEGIAKSLDVVKQLLVDDKGQWKNSLDKPDGKSSTDAETSFVKGDTAMIFCGSWLENEMKDFTPKGFKMKMMPTPLIDGAQVNPETGKPYTINNANAGDVMFIPKEAPNKELAIKFLQFITTEEMMLEFTKLTGMMRPYEYDPIALDPDYAWTDFQKSTFNLYTQSDVNLFEFSRNKSDIYLFKRPELFQEVTVNTALNDLKKKSGAEIMDDVYKKVAVEFPKWKSELGLD